MLKKLVDVKPGNRVMLSSIGVLPAGCVYVNVSSVVSVISGITSVATAIVDVRVTANFSRVTVGNGTGVRVRVGLAAVAVFVGVKELVVGEAVLPETWVVIVGVGVGVRVSVPA